MSFGYTKILVK